MTHVAIVGCGVVGAAIAYDLSQRKGCKITVLDRQPPAQAATGAALGVLMAVISQKLKGTALQMRLTGIQRYDEWLPQLEAIHPIQYNRQGILRLCFAGEDLTRWQHLAAVRRSQGYPLHLWQTDQVCLEYPQLNLDRVIGAVYSPSDRQVDPVALTRALVIAAQQNGVTFRFDAEVISLDAAASCQVHTATETIAADWVVIAAGLGSLPLTKALKQPIALRPVLGQALRVRLPAPLGGDRRPVITGDDVHLVPLGGREYWIGATVEFAADDRPPIPEAAALDRVMQQAISICPAMQHAEIVRSWSGLRPRPEGRPAPIVELLPGYQRILLATGHYRNGVLLAPATAQAVRDILGVVN